MFRANSSSMTRAEEVLLINQPDFTAKKTLLSDWWWRCLWSQQGVIQLLIMSSQRCMFVSFFFVPLVNENKKTLFELTQFSICHCRPLENMSWEHLQQIWAGEVWFHITRKNFTQCMNLRMCHYKYWKKIFLH